MKNLILVLAVLAIAVFAIFPPQANAHHGCGNFGAAGFGFHGQNFNGFGAGPGFYGQNVYGQNFNGQNFNGNGNARVRGANSFASPGGRRLVFVGFDRFGNPIFR